jgi:hypothetical protein
MAKNNNSAKLELPPSEWMCNDDEARMQLRNGRGRGAAKREEAPRGAPDLRPAPAARAFSISPLARGADNYRAL